jgi:hypothetical protein
MTITSTHAQADYIQETFERIQRFFNQLKTNAPQLTVTERWCRILSEAMKKYLGNSLLKPPDEGFLPA